MCTPGYYCSSHGLAEPDGPCAGGWYCIQGSWTDTPADSTGVGGRCLAGTYCPVGSPAPVQCDGGSYCEQDELDAVSGNCDPGFYCIQSAILRNPVNESYGDVCPQGSYCPEGSPAHIMCPEGTYNEDFQMENETNCLPCTGGSYCGGTGNVVPDGLCDEGWFCPAGSTVPQPPGNECLAGHSCPQGSPTETPCASGYYQPNVGQGACLICPDGQYCDQNEAISEQQSGVGEASHGVVTPKICPAGFYCPEGTQTSGENPCPIGTFSNTTGLSNLTQCLQCTQGYYCDSPNIVEPAGLCSPGYYCPLGSISPTEYLCPNGTYCVTGSDQPVNCPKGTYGHTTGLTALADCTYCPPGDYCDSTGLDMYAGHCNAGYFCNNASESANPVGQSYGDECPAGHYCPLRSGSPIACDAGTYNPLTRSINESACVPCDPGMYCDITGLDAVAGNCSAGEMCDPRKHITLELLLNIHAFLVHINT